MGGSPPARPPRAVSNSYRPSTTSGVLGGPWSRHAARTTGPRRPSTSGSTRMTSRPRSRTSSLASPSSNENTPTARSSSTATNTPFVRAPSGPVPLRRIDPAPLGRPLLLVNLKTYPAALGAGAERIARTLEGLGRAAGVAVAIAPAAPDISRLAAATHLRCSRSTSTPSHRARRPVSSPQRPWRRLEARGAS